jgi:mycothiol synthase
MGEKFWTIRNYDSDDFENYALMHTETAKLDQPGCPVSKQLLAETLGHPNFHPHRDLFLAERHQNLVGFVSVFLEPGIGRALLDGLVHPEYRRQGVATDLFKCAVTHARSAGLKVAQISVPETNMAAKQLLLGLGLKFFRTFIGFKLDITNRRMLAVTPGKYIFRRLRPGEEEELTAIQNRSFADTWGFNPNTCAEIAYRINSSTCTPENIIMAYLEDRPVAYCWTRFKYTGNSAKEKKKGEIHMLGVDPDFRRQSLGSKVLAAGLTYLKQKGVEIVELMADGEMPAALALYDSVGFKRHLKVEWFEKWLY